MSEVVINYRFRCKRDTAANFTAANTLLLAGEWGIETDTLKTKVGDGSTAWNSLAYQGIWTLADVRRALDLLGSTAEGDIIYKGASGWTRLAKGTDGQVLLLASGLPSWAAVPGGGSAGTQIGYAYTQSTTAATTSDTSVPSDNTIPQNTEGVAYPSLDTTITPQYSTSLLEVEVVIPYATNSQGGIGLRVIICRDSDADAVYACFSPIVVNAGQQVSILARTVVPANSTAATTFKVRWATGAGTGYLMSLSGTQFYGAANKASMTIREIKQ